MSTKLRWKKSNDYIKKLILPLIIFAGLLIFFYLGAVQTQAAADKESLIFLEKAVIRATVQCYAIEGMYPPDVEYLEKNYGIVVDDNKFIVHYEVFASNILPDITVLEKVGS